MARGGHQAQPRGPRAGAPRSPDLLGVCWTEWWHVSQAGRDRAATKVKCLLVDDLEENLARARPRCCAATTWRCSGAVRRRSARSAAAARCGAGAHRRADAGHGRLRARRADAWQRAHPPRPDHLRDRRRARLTSACSRATTPAPSISCTSRSSRTILKNKAEVFFQLHRQRQQLVAGAAGTNRDAAGCNEMFAAVLGHDLRKPLSAIVTGAQLLEHQLDRRGRAADLPRACCRAAGG